MRAQELQDHQKPYQFICHWITISYVHLSMPYTPFSHMHNFFPGMLTFGACTMALHYEVILAKYMNCPVPVAFGDSGIGKITALWCGLAIVGSNRFFCRGIKEKFLDLCCDSTILIGIYSFNIIHSKRH